jgi:uncharacterized protein
MEREKVRFRESGGQPRQVTRVGDELADWQAAIGYAATLPGVDPARLAIWGYSSAGGHVFRADRPHADGPHADRPHADRTASTSTAPREGDQA